MKTTILRAFFTILTLTCFLYPSISYSEDYITQWGTVGTENGQFMFPYGIAVDSLGNVYVADTWNHRIQKFDSNGTYITQWGINNVVGSLGYGSGLGILNGQFYAPAGVAVDNLGKNVYVADMKNHRIQKFDSNGTYITQWGTPGYDGHGKFMGPTGVAVDSSGNVYVVDDLNRIQKFDSNGIYITQWGTPGTGDGQFSSPQGLAVDGLGNVYVADTSNGRIQKFDSNGTYITQFGTPGFDGQGQLNMPYGVAVDSLGNVYVAETGNHRIQKFDSNGTYITQWGTYGSGNGQFNAPRGVAVNSTLGKVYVADTGCPNCNPNPDLVNNHRIQVFSLSNVPSCVKGDVNNDGNIRSNDAMLILRITAGLLEPNDYQKCAADVNDDGKIRSNDATIVLRKAAGLEAPVKDFIADRHINILLSETHGLMGETITIPITVDNADILSSGDMSISYDSKVLRAIGVLSSDSLLLANNISQPGLIRISFAGVERLNNGKIAEINFEVLTDNISPLTFKMAELYGTDALPLNSKFTNKQFRSWAVAPEHSALLQNYPNPFNPETWMPYQLHEANEVVIRIHNVTGELVREIRLGYKPAGQYTTQDRSAYWDGRNEAGERVSSGVYFYNIQTGKYSSTMKMIVTK